MALIDIGESWERELDTAERLHQHVLAQIGERGKRHRKSSAYTQLTEDIRRTLAQLARQISRLQERLVADSTTITAGEKRRRESILDNLSRKEKELRELVSNTAFASVNQDKKTLFRKPTVSGLADLGTSGWGDTGEMDYGGGGGVHGEETADTAGQSSQTLKERQQEALAQQDAGLDALHSVILKQKGMAQQIGVEIVQQNDIIDEIDDRMDQTTQRLLDNTATVRRVSNKDRTCGYWILILILLIAIIVVGFI